MNRNRFYFFFSTLLSEICSLMMMMWKRNSVNAIRFIHNQNVSISIGCFFSLLFFWISKAINCIDIIIFFSVWFSFEEKKKFKSHTIWSNMRSPSIEFNQSQRMVECLQQNGLPAVWFISRFWDHRLTLLLPSFSFSLVFVVVVVVCADADIATTKKCDSLMKPL